MVVVSGGTSGPIFLLSANNNDIQLYGTIFIIPEELIIFVESSETTHRREMPKCYCTQPPRLAPSMFSARGPTLQKFVYEISKSIDFNEIILISSDFTDFKLIS